MLVSVWITTYNHENYIARAIEGVLMQKTNFDVEIVIGEDCSTDKTRSIILDYDMKFPGKFSLLLPENNLGMIPMFMESHSLCKGKYVAWLDGDDYWTDPKKLQKQVDFLEKHTDCVMCFHNVVLLDQLNNTEQIKSVSPVLSQETIVPAEAFCFHNPVSASSVVCRNILQAKLPGWFTELPYPDLAYYFLLMEQGQIVFINEVMGVYRIHSEGAWSGESRYRQLYLLTRFYELLDHFFSRKFKKYLHKHSAWIYFELLEASLKIKDYGTVRNCLRKILRYNPKFALHHAKSLINALLLVLFRKGYG